MNQERAANIEQWTTARRKAARMEQLENRTLLSAGAFDSSFGPDGRVVTSLIEGEFEQAQAVARQADGKLLVAGYTSQGAGIARYNIDGSLDTDFGGGDPVITFLLSDAVAVAAIDNEQILVAGTINGGNSDFGVVRLNEDGSIDPTFGVSGVATIDVGSALNDTLFAMAVSEGKILLAGSSGADMGIVRLNADGTPDATFSGDGKLTVDFAGGIDIASAIGVQSTDAIVVAGEMFNSVDRDFALVRVTGAGVVDTTFGTNGLLIRDFDPVEISQDAIYSLAVLPDDSLIAAGQATVNGAIDFALAKFSADGQLDASFSTDGLLTTDFTLDPNDPSSDVARAVVVDSAGAIIVAGSAQEVDQTGAAVARYSATGDLDTTFGDRDGRLILGVSGATRYRATALLLQPDDKLVIAGTAGEAFSLIDDGEPNIGGANGAGNFSIARLTLATPILSIGDVSQEEGTGANTTFSFPVTLSVPSLLDVTVAYATVDGTALAGPDYTAASGILTIPAGTLSGTITVTVIGDTSLEADETFAINLSEISRAILADAQAQGTIRNDDAAPTITISNPTVTESVNGTSEATFTITLSNPNESAPVTVNYTTSGGTATPGEDFQPVSGTVTFAPGETTQTIVVPIIGDAEEETDQTFTVDLTAPTGGTIATPSGTATIANLPVRNDTIRSGKKLRFIDADGETVTISLKKGGTAVVSRVGNDPVDAALITLNGSKKKTQLEITTRGTTTVGQIIVNGSASSVIAKKTTLTGRFQASGSLAKIEFRAIENAQVRVGGSIGSFITGSSVGSLIFAGVRSTLSTLPVSMSDILNRRATIKLLKIKNKLFNDTLIAGGKLGKLELGNINTANDGEVFGLAGDSIEKVTGKIADKSLKGFAKKKSSPSATFASGDFVIRLL